MTTQAALIADTIIGLKKALRRENDHSGPDEPITQPTNRGNKLRANAKYVHEGVLGYTNPQELYKEKIEHAGYTRYILRRNPPRYDSEGDELEEDDEDSEADAAAAEENPFSEVAIEQILCPLKHPSELPNHPAMSQPYKSKALRTMTQAIEEKLRKERALLWRARNLHRQFLGDAVWMPCGKVETPEDRFIFEPRPTNEGSGLGINGLTQSEQVLPSGDSASKNTKAAVHEMVQGGASRKNSIAPQTEDQGHPSSGGDIEMTDAPNPETELSQDTKKPKTEDDDAVVADLPQHTESGDSEMKSNGAGLSDTKTNKLQPVGGLRGEVEAPDGNGEVSQEEPSDATVDVEMRNTEQPDEGQDTEETPDGSSPEPLRRMTTRAQANASTTTEENGVANQRPSPAETMDKIPSAHPIFLVPDNIRPDRDFGLPPNEAEETRRLLWSFIQKQDETVRGFEYMLESLLRACRMKDDVYEWCKAEAHLGEMSDGEDWYDREKWGLAEGEDLKKGADEDDVDNNVDEGRTTGKRGRGRR